MAAPHTALRDDSTNRSLSTNERTFLRTSLTLPSHSSISRHRRPVRIDGRTPTEPRPLRLSFGRAHNFSECTVQLGDGTRVVAVVSADLIPPPNADRPSDGVVRFGVDVSPMAGMGYESVSPFTTHAAGDPPSGGGGAADDAQKLTSNRILRILERTLVGGGALDTEALCVQSGKWVWKLSVDVTVLDHGGNVLDASLLSAVAALRHYRKPEVDLNETGDGVRQPVVLGSDEREPGPLPLHHTPLSATYALYADPTGATVSVSAHLDPTDREELVSDGTLTVAFNKHSEMCVLDFPGGCELTPSSLIECAKGGERRVVELCEVLEKALGEADDRAVKERMKRLKAKASEGDVKVLIPDVEENIPFAHQTNLDKDEMDVEADDLGELGKVQAEEAAAKAKEEEKEEEAYRLKALDYALGHVAAKVKEGGISSKGGGGGTNDRGPGGGGAFGGSLMSAMLKSAMTSSAAPGEKVPEEMSEDTKKLWEGATSTSGGRTGNAEDEFTKSTEDATKAAATNSKDEVTSNEKGPAPMDESDEEEGATMMLQSEFTGEPSAAVAGLVRPSVGGEASAVNKEEEVPKQKKEKIVAKDADDDDVDDLAMAVKKKKGKKSKKKGSKKK